MLNIRIRKASIAYRMLVAGALATLANCSSTEDTVVAVNLGFDKIPAGLDTLAVTITRDGQNPVATTITPPTVDVDGGTEIKTAFNQRITLPDSWPAGPAKVHVDAKNASGQTLASVDAGTNVRRDGAVAVFITFTSDDSDAGI